MKVMSLWHSDQRTADPLRRDEGVTDLVEPRIQNDIEIQRSIVGVGYALKSGLLRITIIY